MKLTEKQKKIALTIGAVVVIVLIWMMFGRRAVVVMDENGEPSNIAPVGALDIPAFTPGTVYTIAPYTSTPFVPTPPPANGCCNVCNTTSPLVTGETYSNINQWMAANDGWMSNYIQQLAPYF